MEKKRSIGVTLFGWFYIFAALVNILGILTLENRLVVWQKKMQILLPISYYYVVQCQYIIFSIVYLIAGIALLKLTRWASMFTIIMTTIYYIHAVIFHFLYAHLHITHFISVIIVGFLGVIITIYFFTRPKVKEQFSR